MGWWRYRRTCPWRSSKRPWWIGYVIKEQGKENRRFLYDTVVNGFGAYIKIFLSWETSKRKKNGVRKVPEVGTTHLGTLGKPGAPWCLVPTKVTFVEVSYFPNFRYIRKLTKIFLRVFPSLFTYRITYLLFFHDSGVFRRVSFMCSSGVIVWIILLSTLMGVPEI